MMKNEENDILSLMRSEAIQRRERVANKAYKFHSDEYVRMEDKFKELGAIVSWSDGILESDFYDLRYEPDELKALLEKWRQFLNHKLEEQMIDEEL